MATEQPQPAPAQPAPTAASLGGSRAEAIQRLQVGLFGLAAMLLLVGLASVINSNKQRNEAEVVPGAAPSAASVQAPTVSDPLVDAGVVPDMPTAKPSALPAAPASNRP